jgi:hypothetical protein
MSTKTTDPRPGEPGWTTPERIDAMRARKLEEAPRRYHAMLRRAWARKSRREAVRAFCCECMGWRSCDVADCTSLGCPLYEFRKTG